MAIPLFIFVLLFFGIAVGAGKSRGVPLLTEPKCAKCNYDLRGFSGTAPTRCSECGADLTVRHAIVWGTYLRQPRRIWLAIAVALLPALLIPLLLLRVKSTAIIPGSPAFSARSNAAVIASLATTANTPWDWQELERRLAAGKLSNAEAGQAIDALIAFLKTQPTNQPLSWADNFFTKVDAAGLIPDEQYQRLARAFYKSCTVSVAAKARAGSKLALTVHCSGPWQLPGCEFVYAVRQVGLSDGDSIAVVSNRDRNPKQPNADYLSEKSPFDIAGFTSLNLAPGKYVMTFTVDVAVLQAKSAPQAVDDLPGQASNWPKGHTAWTETITAPVTVVAADQSPITMVNDPAVDPQKIGAIHIPNIEVTRKGEGSHVEVEMQIDGTAVPCSFDVLLRIAGKEYPIGFYVAWPNNGTANDHTCDLPRLDASVVTADILLRPNKSLVEKVAPVDRIWGGPIDLLNLPLKRFDLPGK